MKHGTALLLSTGMMLATLSAAKAGTPDALIQPPRLPHRMRRHDRTLLSPAGLRPQPSRKQPHYAHHRLTLQTTAPHHDEYHLIPGNRRSALTLSTHHSTSAGIAGAAFTQTG